MNSKNLLWWGISIFIVCSFIICFFPYLLTRSGVIDFTDTGPIGDTIGGIMGPFVSLLGAFLTFLAFWAQYKANTITDKRWQIEQLEDGLAGFKSRIEAEIVEGKFSYSQVAEARSRLSVIYLIVHYGLTEQENKRDLIFNSSSTKDPEESLEKALQILIYGNYNQEYLLVTAEEYDSLLVYFKNSLNYSCYFFEGLEHGRFFKDETSLTYRKFRKELLPLISIISQISGRHLVLRKEGSLPSESMKRIYFNFFSNFHSDLTGLLAMICYSNKILLEKDKKLINNALFNEETGSIIFGDVIFELDRLHWHDMYDYSAPPI